MKKLPIGIQTFSKFIEQNLLYVDKTEIIYKLITAFPAYQFLSRPRRFGKSLLISTLKEIYSGNKSLFDGLWIFHSDYHWQEYPIIHLDFLTIDFETAAKLEASLIWKLDQTAKQYSVDISDAPDIKAKLELLIELLSKKNKVVLLIDEYDKPILDNLDDVKLAGKIRDKLRGFYDVLKGVEASLHKIFVTGVTKFSKTSIFSGINNLDDISIYPIAAELLGYTSVEIDIYFRSRLEEMASANGTTLDHEQSKMQIWYNGYRFSDAEIKVFNPFSVLHYLDKNILRNYWYDSGTPSFLARYIKKQYADIKELPSIELKPHSLGTFQIDNIPLIPLLFQTGYLTIQHYNKDNDTFQLNFPNFEVEESFKKLIVTTLSGIQPFSLETLASQLLNAIKINDIRTFCTILKTLFAHVPYTLHLKHESYYHSLFQFLISMLSLESQSEILTNQGRIDLVIFSDYHIHLFELKLNNSAEKALQQILEKRYYERFIGLDKKIILVGLSFTTHDHTLEIEHATREINEKEDWGS